jgi:hypothetical protein
MIVMRVQKHATRMPGFAHLHPHFKGDGRLPQELWQQNHDAKSVNEIMITARDDKVKFGEPAGLNISENIV